MRRAMIFSAMLHLSVAVVAVLGLPVLSDREPVVDRPVVIEVVRLAEKTTPPPSPPKREPPKPAPPRPAEPKPEPAEPKAVEIPPPPEAVKIPPPPPPETVLARPEPKPEPKPKPKVELEPKPKPKPKVTKLVPKPKPKLRANRLAKAKPGRKPLTPREDFIAPLLKNLSREERQLAATKPPEKVAEATAPALPPPRPSVDLRMTVSELDAIRRQIEA